MPGALVRLIADDLTGRAGEPAAGPHHQTDRTKWTDRIRGGRNRFKFLAKREVPGNAKQTDGKKNRPGRRGKSSNPADDRKAGISGKRPERDRGADQRTQCSPPEIATAFSDSSAVSGRMCCIPSVSNSLRAKSGSSRRVLHRTCGRRWIGKEPRTIRSSHPETQLAWAGNGRRRE
jgi:hypothetical protein